MLSNGVEMSLIFRQILGPLVLGWAPNHFVLGAQLASGEKRLVCIPALQFKDFSSNFPVLFKPRFKFQELFIWSTMVYCLALIEYTYCNSFSLCVFSFHFFFYYD